MVYEEIDFFGGRPAVLETSGEPVPLLFAKYIFDSGYFYLFAATPSKPIEFKDVLYEDIDTSKEGRIEFDSQGSKVVMRSLEEEDGVWLLPQSMPMNPKILGDFLKKDHETEEDIMQTVQALVNPDTEEISAIIFDVSNLGIFFRTNNEWDYPTPDMLDVLESTDSYVIKDDLAKDFVAEWDKGKKMKLSDLDEYRAEEE